MLGSLLVLLAVAAVAVADKTLSLLFVQTRHGERNPGQFLKDDPNKGRWGQEGGSNLNTIGKQRQYALGQAIRERYSKFLPVQWNPNEFSGMSSSAERCQMTFQMLAAGIFPPQDWSVWNRKLLWQPVPYTIDDTLLRAYNRKCAGVTAAWKPANEGTEPYGKNLTHLYKKYIDLAAKKEGLKADLTDAADIADNLIALKERGWKLPAWADQETFHAIEQLAEAPQIACAEYGPCRKLMAGFWANTILNKMKEKQVKRTSTQKFYMFTTHNEILSSLFWIFKQQVRGVAFGTGAIIEYSTDNKGWVRMFRAEPKDTPQQVKFEPMPLCTPSTDGWCSFDTVHKLVQSELIEDMDRSCPLSASG